MLKGKLLHFLYDQIIEGHGRVNQFFLSYFGFLSFAVLPPLVLRLRTSMRCNLSCSFCYQSDSLNQGESGYLTENEWLTFIQKLPKTTVVDVTGGETFISKNFSFIMKHVLKRCQKVSLITNGLLVKEDILKMLVDGKLFYFMVSVDGLEKYHNKVRGNSKSFENILKTLKILTDYKKSVSSKYPQICIKITITHDNSAEILPLIKLMHKNYGIDDFTLNLMFQNVARGGNQLFESLNDEAFFEGNTQDYPVSQSHLILKDLSNIKAFCKSESLSLKIKPNVGEDGLEDYLKSPEGFGVPSCYKKNSVITMYYDGTIAPCDLALDLCNVRDYGYDLRKVLKGGEYSSFFKRFKSHYNPACEGCCLKKHYPKN